MAAWYGAVRNNIMNVMSLIIPPAIKDAAEATRYLQLFFLKLFFILGKERLYINRWQNSKNPSNRKDGLAITILIG